MTKEEHDWYYHHIKRFGSLKAAFNDMAAGFSRLEADLVDRDNSIKSADAQLATKKLELEKIEKTIRERRVIAEASTINVREQLNKRDLDLREKEEKLRYREQILAEKEKEKNEKITAADRVIRGKVAVSAGA